MYDIYLNIGGSRISLTPSNGYYISTISGLTGISTDWDLSQAQNAVGQIATNPVSKGKQIVIKGLILDDNKAAKNALINAVRPRESGTISVLGYVAGSSNARFETEVVVKETATISQEKHAKFNISLYAPFPYWRQNAVNTSLASYNDVNISVSGTESTEYRINMTVGSGSVSAATIELDRTGTSPTTLGLTFNPSVSSGSRIRILRRDGRLICTVDGEERKDAISLQSSFWYLPIGTHTVRLTVVGGGVSAATISFYPLWGGVISAYS